MTYDISEEAANDLEDIWYYTLENWSLEQADRYLKLVLEEITYLAGKPEVGKDYGKVRKRYRIAKVKSHFIFYKINLKENNLIVIRVLHEMMDIESHLI